MQTDLDIKIVFFIILRNLWLILLSFVILFVGAYFIFEYNKTPQYTASVTMYISSKGQTDQTTSTGVNGNTTLTELNTAQKLIDTYSIVLKSNTAIDAVAQILGNKYDSDFIRETLTLSSVSETEVMEIESVTENAQLSADICNAIVDIAPDILKEKVKVGTVELIDSAKVPSVQSNPRSFKTPFVGGLAGAVLAAGLAIFSFMLDTKIKSKDDIKSRYKINILGEIPNFGDIKRHRGYNYKSSGDYN